MTEDYNYTPEGSPGDKETALARRIATDNDAFRKMPNPDHGEVLVTQAVHSLGEIGMRQLLHLVRTFDQFTEENDPFGQHEFGSIMLGGTTYFWKIDLYDRATKSMYTPDANDPDATWRVLTIMEASEY